MPRYVLRRQSREGSPSVDPVRGLTGIRIIDETDDTAMLVEADAETIKAHEDRLAGWSITEEMTYPLPADPPFPLGRPDVGGRQPPRSGDPAETTSPRVQEDADKEDPSHR